MYFSNDTRTKRKECLPDIHGYRWIGEGCINVVDWDGIEGVCSIAAYINHHSKASLFTRLDDLLSCDKGGDLRREVDAVHKNVNIEDFLEWSALGRLIHIPFDNVIPAQ